MRGIVEWYSVNTDATLPISYADTKATRQQLPGNLYVAGGFIF